MPRGGRATRSKAGKTLDSSPPEPEKQSEAELEEAPAKEETQAPEASGDSSDGDSDSSGSDGSEASGDSVADAKRRQQEEKLKQEQDQDSETQEEEEEVEPQTEEEARDALRENWKFAAVLQFARIFTEALQLKGFSADILESAIVNPSEHQAFLGELVFKLIREDPAAHYVERDAEGYWEADLANKIHRLWRQYFPRNPLHKRGYFELSTEQRVDVLYALCDWRIHDCPVLRETMRTMVDDPEVTADVLRAEPVGEDGRGARYYFLSGDKHEDCYLFKEVLPKPSRGGKRGSAAAELPPDAEAEWSTECTTLEELQEFAKRMSASRNKVDKELGELIDDEILPELVSTADARRRAAEKAAAYEALPSKRSGRLHVLQKKKEEEDAARKAREAEERRKKEEETREKERKRREKEREQRLKEMEEARRKFLGITAQSGPTREERMRARMVGRRWSEEPRSTTEAGSSSDSDDEGEGEDDEGESRSSSNSSGGEE